MDGYRAFLVARDGEPDLERHRLSRREEFFARLACAPVRSDVRLDRATYLRNLARARPEPGLDERMLWLLATAKANQAERFGVGHAELFAAEPTVAARIRLLYDEILADELCHVGFIAARLGPTGRALMRGLYRLGALHLAAQMPEIVQLFGRAELGRRFREPFRLGDMVAEFPARAFAAGHL